MHAIFIPYGRKEWVDFLIRDMTAQKLPIKIYDKIDGKFVDAGSFLTECQVRILPGGLIDFVFPKEYADYVLSELGFDDPHNGHSDFDLYKEFSFGPLKIKPLELFKKWARIEDIPKFENKGITFGWYKFWVSIIPIGVRYEQDFIQEKEGSPIAGKWHEGI